jgi:hypothetical protein
VWTAVGFGASGVTRLVFCDSDKGDQQQYALLMLSDLHSFTSVHRVLLASLPDAIAAALTHDQLIS